MRGFVRFAACAVFVVAACGCATTRSPTLHDRLIKPGTPKVSIGEPLNTGSGSLEEFIRRVRHLSTAKPAPRSLLLPTIEQRDPGLQQAIFAEAVAPTAAHHRQVGNAYYRLRILDAANARFNMALKVTPTDAAAFEGLARVWRDWEQPQLALGDAYRATYYAPGWAAGWNTLGTVLQALGQRDEARKAYRAAVAVDSRAAYAWNNLCYLSVLEARATPAVAECREALAIDPSLNAARNNLALAFAARGENARSSQELMKAGNASTGHYNVGIVRLAQGQYVEAAEAFDRARAARPLWRDAIDRGVQARSLAARTGNDQENHR